MSIEKDLKELDEKLESFKNEYKQRKAKVLGTNILNISYDGINHPDSGKIVYKPNLKQVGDNLFLYVLKVDIISKDTDQVFLSVTGGIKMECILDDKDYTKTFASHCGLTLLHPILRGLIRDITNENGCVDIGIVFPKKINKITEFEMLERIKVKE